MTTYLTLQNPDNLRVLQLSKELVKKVGRITEALPFEEGHIKGQLTRSSTSIVQCIAKAEQLYLGQKKNLYSAAIGSAQETKSFLMDCVIIEQISEGEFLAFDSMLDTIITMLNRILENLNGNGTDLPSTVTQNIKTLPCFRTAQELVKELYELGSYCQSEWQCFIMKLTINSARNIKAHVSEAEQLYRGKKLSSLNYALQESNGVKAYLDLMKDGVFETEKYHDLKEMVTEIQHILVREMKRIEPGIKDKL